METDETQSIELHNLILGYVYETQNLPLSCFNHYWEDFKSKNPGVKSSSGKFLLINSHMQFHIHFPFKIN
jgi:hypothetical protein